MSKTLSLSSALLCTFIWGTTFIAQDTGMDDIGPFTFNSLRFFVGFLAIIPLALLFEVKKLKKIFSKHKGSKPVYFDILDTNNEIKLNMISQQTKVSITKDLLTSLEKEEFLYKLN